MKASGIYSITHVASGRIYVGSAQSLDRRWFEHRAELRLNTHCNQRLQYAWNKYGEEGFAFEVLELVSDKTLLIQREQHWLNTLLAAVKPNFNICPTAGSSLGVVHSAETRAKVSAANSRPRKPLSEEHRAILSAKAMGRKMHPNSRAALLASHLGKKRPPEFGEKLSAMFKGRVISPEWRMKMSIAAKNRSPEHRAKIGAAMRRLNTAARLNTPEVTVKRLAALRSPESRAKISAAGLRRYSKI